MGWSWEFSPTSDERREAEAIAAKRRAKSEHGHWGYRLFGLAIALLWAGAGIVARTRGHGMDESKWWTFLAWLLALCLLGLAYRRHRANHPGAATILGNGTPHDSPQRLAIDSAGVHLAWAHGTDSLSWQAVVALEQGRDTHVLHLDSGHGVLLPHRVFQSDEECRSCLEFIRSQIGAAGAKADTGTVEHESTTAAPASTRAAAGVFQPVRQLLAVLLAGLRLAFFRPLGATALAPAPPLIPALMGLGLALHFGAAFLAVDGAGQWNTDGLVGTTFPVALALAAAAVLAALAGQSAALAGLLTLLLALALPLYVAELLLEVAANRRAEDAWLARYGRYIVPLWLALAAAVAAIRWTGLSGLRRAGAFAATGLLLALPLSTVNYGAALWVAKENEAADDPKYYALAREETFYQQPRLLDAALDRLQAQRPGVADLYFVGLGGYAGQDVFMKEVRAVERLMGERFGAAGRSVSLVNNYTSVADYPVASATGLKRTLQRIGRTMDKDEDILFLFMTSHGSREQGVNIDFWPMQFYDIAPAALRRMLDDAGIKWRVVVVSACYSGVFVEPLRDEHTIVLTASAADRNSFGCSNELDWTYFGQAFFDEALRKQTDLPAAFEQAQRSIEQREKREHIDLPSQPQIAAGNAMREKWAAYTRQLEAGAPPAAAAQAAPGKDIYQDYAGLWHLKEYLPEYRKECRHEMEYYAPSKKIARQPELYGGIGRESPLWPNLVAAWQDYVESYCEGLDDQTYQDLFTQALRKAVPGEEVKTLFRLLGTPEGAKFIEAERRSSALFRQLSAETRLPKNDQIGQRFQQTVARLVQAHKQQQAKPDEPARAKTESN